VAEWILSYEIFMAIAFPRNSQFVPTANEAISGTSSTVFFFTVIKLSEKSAILLERPGIAVDASHSILKGTNRVFNINPSLNVNLKSVAHLRCAPLGRVPFACPNRRSDRETKLFDITGILSCFESIVERPTAAINLDMLL
jgi:hypothetical protein